MVLLIHGSLGRLVHAQRFVVMVCFEVCKLVRMEIPTTTMDVHQIVNFKFVMKVVPAMGGHIRGSTTPALQFVVIPCSEELKPVMMVIPMTMTGVLRLARLKHAMQTAHVTVGSSLGPMGLVRRFVETPC